MPPSSEHLWQSLFYSSAESLLFLNTCAILVADLFLAQKKSTHVAHILSLVTILLSIWLLCTSTANTALLFSGHFVISNGIIYIKILLLIAYMLSLFLIETKERSNSIYFFTVKPGARDLTTLCCTKSLGNICVHSIYGTSFLCALCTTSYATSLK